MGGRNTLTLALIAGVGVATGGFGFAAGGSSLAASAAAAGPVGSAAWGNALLFPTVASSGFSLSTLLPYASAALTAGGQIMSGRANAAAYRAEAAQYDLERSAEATQAAIEEENRQQRLKSLLSTQAAIFGASNIQAYGPGDVLAQQSLSEVNTATYRGRGKAGVVQTQLKESARQSRISAKNSGLAGYVEGLSTVGRFAGDKFGDN